MRTVLGGRESGKRLGLAAARPVIIGETTINSGELRSGVDIALQNECYCCRGSKLAGDVSHRS